LDLFEFKILNFESNFVLGGLDDGSEYFNYFFRYIDQICIVDTFTKLAISRKP